MKKQLMLFLFYLVSFGIKAATIVDIYGTDPSTSADLIKNYGAQVGDNEARFLDELAKAKSASNYHAVDVLVEHRFQLINQIKQHYGFSYVDFDTIIYPHHKAYTTIEVVSKLNTDRLRFVNKMTKPSPKQPQQDLIEKMVEFQTKWAELMLTSRLEIKETTQCPVYHCLPGFSHPKLKDHFALFNAAAMKEKALILRTIKKDPNQERRTAAIYLMGHFADPKEIISYLTNYIMDSDSSVRNGAMRVINATMRKAKIQELDVLPLLSLLESPYDTDRNKALLLLSTAARSKASKELIIRQGKEKLIALLRLKQPNNHDASYALLKQLSGNDFGAHNVVAWEQWLLKMNSAKR